MSEEIKNARETMRKAFEANPDFFETYKANVGLLLYDYFNKADFGDYDTREQAAEYVLKKIFWD